MEQSSLKALTLTIGGSLLVLWAVLLGSSGWPLAQRQPQVPAVAPEQGDRFTQSTARIQAQLQTLRRLEKDMLSGNASPAKLEGLGQKWHQARRSIDELVGQARQAAANDEQRKQIEQFAALANSTDERLRQIAAARRNLETIDQPTGARQ